MSTGPAPRDAGSGPPEGREPPDGRPLDAAEADPDAGATAQLPGYAAAERTEHDPSADRP